MTQPFDHVQVIQGRLLCHCGAPAVMTFAFPGSAKQGRCATHEQGTELRKEIEPGRTFVASVERLDGPDDYIDPDSEPSRLEGQRGGFESAGGWRPGRGS